MFAKNELIQGSGLDGPSRQLSLDLIDNGQHGDINFREGSRQIFIEDFRDVMSGDGRPFIVLGSTSLQGEPAEGRHHEVEGHHPRDQVGAE
jgi:hypothetical protein